MKLFRAALPLIALLAVAPASAQSARGTWEGFAYTNNSSQKVTVVLDSVATGWKGTIVSAQLPETLALTTVTLKADTLSFGIPYNGMTIWISGLVAASKFNGQLWVGNDNAGTIELSRKDAAADKAPAKP